MDADAGIPVHSARVQARVPVWVLAVFGAVSVYVVVGLVHDIGRGATQRRALSARRDGAQSSTKPTPDDLAAAATHLNFPGYHPPRACNKLDGPNLRQRLSCSHPW